MVIKKFRFFVLLIILATLLFYHFGRGIWYPLVVKLTGKKTVAQVIAKHGPITEEQLSSHFLNVGLNYPPEKLALVAFKDTKVLEIWAAKPDSNYQLVKSYPIKAASGELGPKLREGDRQVPEGIYKITAFNPNSSYHLSMKINYPNEFDLKYAEEEGRTEPGTNIFIHGKAVSIGCLAMGDSAIEQLFSLVKATGIKNTSVLISPTDPSKNQLKVPDGSPQWTGLLYENIEQEYTKINSKYKN